MPSTRFNILRTNVAELRRLLLPSKFSPTGSYTSPRRVSMRSLSFRVLAHAEIETYFEERAIEVAKEAWLSWKSTRHVSTITLHLLAYSGQQTKNPPKSLQAPKGKKAGDWRDEEITIHSRVEYSANEYIKGLMHANHGIKEKNIVPLILAIGFDAGKCDPLAITQLDQFGVERGAAAHSSAIGTASKFIDPRDEHAKVRRIIQDLVPFDVEFDRLLKLAKR